MHGEEPPLVKAIRKASYSGVSQSYPAWKARSDRINTPYSYYVMGGIAMRLTPLFVNAGLHANTVTLLGSVILLLGLIFIMLGAVDHRNFLIGAAFLNLSILFDCIDGHVARFKGECSKFGALLDHLVSLLHYSLLPVCLALALFFGPPERLPLSLGLDVPKWVWLAAGSVRTLAYLLPIEVGRKTQLLLGGKGYDERMSNTLLLALSKGIIEFESFFLFIAALIGATGFLLLAYAAYHVLILTAVIIRNLRELVEVDKERPGHDTTPPQEEPL